MTYIIKTVTFVSLGVLSLGLTGCEKNLPQATALEAKVTTVKQLSIGYQKAALNLLVTRQQKLLEQQFPNVKLDWKEFPAGPQMLEALAVGAVDFGYVGNTPPIFAQAAAKEIRYVGYELVTPTSQALVIPQTVAFTPYRI